MQKQSIVSKVLQILCMDRSISENEAAIPLGRDGAYFTHDFAPRDLRLAVPSRKRWPNGYELKCTFLGGSELQRKLVQTHASIWEQCANIRFLFGTYEDAEIRISFLQGSGSWSAVGTDALNKSYFPKSTATMNFGWLSADADEKECRRVVLHEFGHALGAIHEHQQPDASLSWNEPLAFRVFSGPPNHWTREQIRLNIFERYSRGQINWSKFDPDSIMLYYFPPELFLGGKGTRLNQELSDLDRVFIGELYPRRSSIASSPSETESS
jgi:hypothetical protein